MITLPRRVLYPLLLIVVGAMLSSCGGPSLTVNSSDDTDDGTCTASHCSLREAINKANAELAAVTIKFDIGGGGVHTIQPATALPQITVPVFIDGTTQPGYISDPLIELDGSQAGMFMVDGFVLRGGKSTVKRLVINNFSGNGISMLDAGGNRIQGCYIGTDVSGMIAKKNGADGVRIIAGEENIIGGGVAGERNVISGNTMIGVRINGIKASVIGNYIGVDAAGGAALPNGTGGVVDNAGLATIGGASVGGRNVISGNGLTGVSLEADDSYVLGNLIGTDATGKIGLGNKKGVSISGSHNTVGGDSAGKRNIISANAGEGVTVDSGAEDNAIQGNYIGTDIDGANALGNGILGVYVAGGINIIGGKLGSTGNVISGNLGDGVVLDGILNYVRGNLIGLDAAGTAGLGNSGRGVTVNGSFNYIGWTDPGTQNVISDNGSDGVGTFAPSSTDIRGNYIGTDVTGSAALGNHRNGVFVGSGGGVAIGGSLPGMMNVISANGLNGVWLDDNSQFVSFYGNHIGTDATGTAALKNAESGISVGGAEHSIGLPCDNCRNLISGNGGPGITIRDKATEILVQHNFIGTDVTGKAALGNEIGIRIDSLLMDPDLQIGGSILALNEGNVISGNRKDGILLLHGASVWGNNIGTDDTGTGPLGNGGNGILVQGSGNQIGGPASGNMIAFNTGHGVAVISGSGKAVKNAIQVNHIHDNGGLGIAIDADTVLINDSMDADKGDNGRQNHPDLLTAFVDTAAGTTTLVGKFKSQPNTTYSIEVFANAACDPSGNGEGHSMFQKFMLTTNAVGYAVINQLVANSISFYPGNFFTVTATDPEGNTSGFSNCVSMTEVASPVKTDTPGAMTFKPLVDPAEIFYGDCDPTKTRISIEIGNPPEEISYVLLFVRLMDPKTNAKTDWGGALTMLSPGKNQFFYDLSAYDVPDYEKFEEAVLQYQFVVYNAAQERVGTSEVFGDIAFARCSSNAVKGVD